MDFRWKNFGTPAGFAAAQNMQGYVPGYVGREPRAVPEESVISPSGTFGGGNRGPGQEAMQQFQPGYFENAERVQLQARYQQLEQELAQVDTKIAEVKKKYPGITNEREWRIAAKRAEIGDMSAYDNMMSRGQQYGEKANGIENMLYDAMKLTWGLGAKSDEDRAFARNQIEVALRKAESEAARTGVKLPAIYDELKASLNPQQTPPGATQGATGNWAGKNAREIGNELESLKRAKKLHDSDLVELQKIADVSSNKEETETIQKLIKEYQPKTVEAAGRYSKKKARGEQLLKEAANQQDVARWYGSLSKSDAEALKTVASVTKDSLGRYTFTKKP